MILRKYAIRKDKMIIFSEVILSIDNNLYTFSSVKNTYNFFKLNIMSRKQSC